MPHTSDQRFLVLHGCKLKGFAEPSAIGPVIGLKPPAIAKILQTLVKEGLAKHLEGGRISGYALTPAGKEEQVRMAEADLAASGARDVVQSAYERFLVLNADLLAVCTAWQVRDIDRNILNDHSDRDYDAGVIKRLADVHAGVTPINAELSAALDRYHHYQPRLVFALDKVKKGNQEWFAKPILDSYHTVWMELHEDLLSTLHIERASEDV
jgi:DNA-binding PadR family transcriptional regulator